MTWEPLAGWLPGPGTCGAAALGRWRPFRRDLPRIFEPITAPVALLLGIAGWLAADGAGHVSTSGPDSCHRLDLRIYSPLCLALAALVLGDAAV